MLRALVAKGSYPCPMVGDCGWRAGVHALWDANFVYSTWSREFMSIRNLFLKRQFIGLLFATAVVPLISPSAVGDSPVPVTELAGRTHFHGIAVDAKDPARLYLATHHGFYLVAPDGLASRISNNQNDYMGFTPHPVDPDTLFASGHPAGGGNTGFIVSEDGGRTWRQRAKGVNGPVDFHQMDVSRSDPQVIYGVYGGLQVSRDGGHSWEMRAEAPVELFDLAVSSTDADLVYAATRGGLLVSANGGVSWQPAHYNTSPATMVQSTAQGSVYAFIAGLGLLRGAEGSVRWEPVSNGFGDRYLLHLAADPTDPETLYVITSEREVLESHDGGTTWGALGGE